MKSISPPTTKTKKNQKMRNKLHKLKNFKSSMKFVMQFMSKFCQDPLSTF